MGDVLARSTSTGSLDGGVGDEAAVPESPGNRDAILKPVADVDVSRRRRERAIGRDCPGVRRAAVYEGDGSTGRVMRHGRGKTLHGHASAAVLRERHLRCVGSGE